MVSLVLLLCISVCMYVNVTNYSISITNKIQDYKITFVDWEMNFANTAHAMGYIIVYSVDEQISFSIHLRINVMTVRNWLQENCNY